MSETVAEPDLTDAEDEPNDHAAARARQLAGYLIVAGVVVAGCCIAFIVWEQWRANQAALRSQTDDGSASLSAFPVGVNGKGSHPAPDHGAPDSSGPHQSAAPVADTE